MFHSAALPRLALLALTLWVSPLALATMTTGSNSARLTWGDVTQGSGVSTATNAASGAFDRQYLGTDVAIAGYWSLGGGLEYGDLDELFELYNDTSAALERIDNGSGSGGSGTQIDIIDDIESPALNRLISQAEREAVLLSALLQLIESKGYAMAQGGSELALLLNNDVAGGTLRLDINGWVSSSAVGIMEEIDFDVDDALAALEELSNLYDLQPGDPETSYDLSGGLSLSINPTTGRVRATFENDSLLLTRAARAVEMGLSYSRPLFSLDKGQLFVGVRPKITQIGLSRVSTRLGDLEDAEAAFDDILNASFVTQARPGLDLGMLWQASHYRAGLSIINLSEPVFDFPAVNYQQISDAEVRAQLQQSDTYVAQRQFKFEGALAPQGQRWQLLAALDGNTVSDAAGIESRWGSLSAGYSPRLQWCNNLRIGLSHNFAGSELSYLSGGTTLFQHLQLDLASALTTTVIEGMELPRGLSLALGWSDQF